MKPLVALAEDDELLRVALRDALESDGWQVLELEDGFELADYLDFVQTRRPPTVVLADVRMPGLSGLDVVERARLRGMACPVIMMTSWPDAAVNERAKQLGATQVIKKPAELDQLLELMRSTLSKERERERGVHR